MAKAGRIWTPGLEFDMCALESLETPHSETATIINMLKTPLLNQNQLKKWAKEKKDRTLVQWSKVLIFGGPKVRTKSGDAWKLKFPQLVVILESHDICCCWSTGFIKFNGSRTVSQEILEIFIISSAEKLCGDADFILSSRIWHLHTLKKDLTGPERIRESWRDKTRDTRANNADEVKSTWASNLDFFNTWADPQADLRHAMLHSDNSSCRRSPDQSAYAFFLLVLCNNLVFCSTEFWCFYYKSSS